MSNYPATAQTAVPAYGSKTINGATSFNGALTIAPDAASSGARTCITVTQPADTAITASTEQPIVFYDFSATQTWATGSLTTQRFLRIAAPTIAFAGASTVTTAATVDIAGAPIAGTNATITNAYALRVATGASYFGGALTVGSYSILTGNVGVGSAAPASAALAVSSTTQGFLPPRMTGTQRDAIAAPAAGLVVYNTTTNKLNFYNGSAWEVVTSA